MKTFILKFVGIFLILFTAAAVIKAQPTGLTVEVKNYVQISANQLSFEIWLTNTGTTNLDFSSNQYAFSFNKAILNSGGVGSLTKLATDLPAGLFPPSYFVNVSGALGTLRTSSNLPPGAGTYVMVPLQTVMALRLQLATTAASFTTGTLDLVYRNSLAGATGSTKLFYFAPGGLSVQVPDAIITSIIPPENPPLPVEFASFTANVTNTRDVSLNWKTSKETNNKGFDIERKTTDGSWAKVGYIDGKGTTNNETSYKYDDKKLNTGKYNYRLKQIDYNGNFQYNSLNTVIDVGLPTKFDLSQNYPNPFNPTTKIDYQLPADGKVSILIYDISGREVKTLLNNEVRTAGYYTTEFNAGSIASGTYFYRFIAESNGKQTVMTKKMLLIK